MICTCGHAEDEHDDGECQVEDCMCFYFEEDEEAEAGEVEDEEEGEWQT